MRLRRPRIFYGWYIVLAGFMGNVTAGGIQSFTFGVIFKPMADALAWGRGPLAGGLAVRQVGGAFIRSGSYMIPFGVFVCTYTFGGVLILVTKPPRKTLAAAEAAALLRV